MNVLLASSEAVPFAKTGGLADVASALTRALVAEGHAATLVIPHHRPHLVRAGIEPTYPSLQEIPSGTH